MSNTKKKEQPLFTEFPPVSLEEWESVIKRDLDGEDYKEKLKWDTGEGVEVPPFYHSENLQSPRRHPILQKEDEQDSWAICNFIFAQDVSEANRLALQALNNGAGALKFKVNVRSTAGMLGGDLEGTAIQTQSDFEKVFENIPLDLKEIHFDSGMASPVILAMLLNEIKNRETVSETVTATFSYDPCSYIITKGQLSKPEKKLKNEVFQLTEACSTFSGIKPLCADARTWHNSGSTIVQELALGLAGASEYMALLTDQDMEPNTAANSIHFSYSVGSKYFLEIAKLRALRLLWRQLLEAYTADKDLPAFIHAETSSWNKTVYDSHVNVLRTTTEGMSAAISGADSITTFPFDSTYRQPDDFSDRIARNSQIILKEEAHFDKVADPAAGSYYVEELTDKLGQQAWNLFQEIEQEGGLLTSIQNGTVQSLLNITRRKRDQAIAARGRVFVGTNQYSNTGEEMAGKLYSSYKTVSLKETETEIEFDAENLIDSISNSFKDGAALGDIIPKLFDLDWSKHRIRTISPYRGPEAFEKLRLATERHEKKPLVLTLPIGDRKKRKARSAYANNFFGCAGYRIEDPIGFDDAESALQAVKEKKPDIVVLCSSDNDYPELIPVIAKGVNELSNAPILVLSGYPEKEAEKYKRAGVDEFIHSGCNVLETLERFHSKLGIAEKQ